MSKRQSKATQAQAQREAIDAERQAQAARLEAQAREAQAQAEYRTWQGGAGAQAQRRIVTVQPVTEEEAQARLAERASAPERWARQYTPGAGTTLADAEADATLGILAAQAREALDSAAAQRRSKRLPIIDRSGDWAPTQVAYRVAEALCATYARKRGASLDMVTLADAGVETVTAWWTAGDSDPQALAREAGARVAQAAYGRWAIDPSAQARDMTDLSIVSLDPYLAQMRDSDDANYGPVMDSLLAGEHRVGVAEYACRADIRCAAHADNPAGAPESCHDCRDAVNGLLKSRSKARAQRLLAEGVTADGLAVKPRGHAQVDPQVAEDTGEAYARIMAGEEEEAVAASYGVTWATLRKRLSRAGLRCGRRSRR